MKNCSKCLAEKPLSEFYAHPFGNQGVQGKCKECTKAAVRANRRARMEYYRSYDRARAKTPERVEARRSYALKNPRKLDAGDQEKRAARITVGNAIRDGKLVPSPECEICSYPCDTHAHHDDYKNHLNVMWVCTGCHALIHRYWEALDRKGY